MRHGRRRRLGAEGAAQNRTVRIGENPEVAPVAMFLSRALKWYAPGPRSGVKIALLFLFDLNHGAWFVEPGRLLIVRSPRPRCLRCHPR